MKTTLTGALTHQAQTRPQSAAFVFQEEVWTYERLAAEAERLARGLAERGVGPGDRVAIHMMNRPEMVVAYYACFKLGSIAAPLRTAFKFAELTPILQRLKPALYIGDANLYGSVAPVDPSILALDKRFIVNGAIEDHGMQRWETLFDAATDVSFPDSTASCKPALLIITSGTTGQPKFVVHTPATLSESVELVVKHWGLSDDDVMIEPLPMAHMSGLITFLSLIRFGAPFVLLEGFDADSVLDNIERHRCTWCLGFPAQYAALLECQRARPRDLSSLRVCLTGADICPIDLQERVTAIFGAPLYNIWGATEAVGSLTFGLQRGPVARIVKGARIRLIDKNGADVADGEAGELLIRGANVFDSYWNDPDATEKSLKAGWYHTGDLMRRGAGDELWFVSRKKDIIIRGGTNISPAEVEEALVACHPAVEEAAVVGVPDAVLGQRVFGFVKLVNRMKDTIVSEILRSVATRLASYKVPETLEMLDELPRNALSKVDRNVLQTMAVRADKAGRLRIGPVFGQPKQPDTRTARRPSTRSA
jgi:acyl-CoA synthetase (AMP-forming)/AMP-acid ligase II